MRVVAGKVRGLSLKTLDGDSTRPTRDMVREALFNIIANKTSDAIFLDLFAGSGAIGIEALSRGAKKVYFVDVNKEAIGIVKQNVEKAKFCDNSVIIQNEFSKALDTFKNEKFDIIFVDPPYNKGLGIEAIEKISDYNLLSEDGIIVYETDKIEEVPEEIGRYKRYDYRKYGRNILNFYF